jgi:catechol 2,3-dioxygenase-like lactoylglutathione lyase family enzyme
MQKRTLVTRRQAMLLAGAAVASRRAGAASALFQGVEITHVSLTVTALQRSREFYRDILGLPVLRPDVLGVGEDYVALAAGATPGMNHFGISIEEYSPEAVVEKLRGAKLDARTAGGAVYVKDPDGIQVRLCETGHFAAGLEPREPVAGSLFTAVEFNHMALSVSDVGRSREFYQMLLGLPVISQGAANTFLGMGKNFLALFGTSPAGLNHYCYSIRDYEVGRVVHALESKGLRPRRTANRVYFPDPDGLTVQLAEVGHGA